MFETVLVANRGEIAVRVLRTLRRLGIRSVAVYSDADFAAPHVRLADEAVRLGPTPVAQSYLSAERVLDAAGDCGARAIHPGYGFLSESAAFARACNERGIVFVGPPPEVIEALGDKVSAKLLAQSASVPVLPGLQRRDLTDEEIIAFAEQPGHLPLMVKAAAGGGGRGMRVAKTVGELPEALGAARREAVAGFADDALLVERYVERARHIEVQLLADGHGTVVHLGERECSLQRRHQKVLEESPSPVVSPGLRDRLGEAAVRMARAAGYVGAGTAEFLVCADEPDEFFFLEVNARLQVEHPVTEQVTGLDLVEKQLLIAAGEPLGLVQEDIELRGHAVEVRLGAEDPAAGFLPATGTIVGLVEPQQEGVRIDSGVGQGSVVSASYDSLLAKIIATGRDRPEAFERLARALADLRVLGVITNAGFLARLVSSPEVLAGVLDTGLIERDVVRRPPSQDEARQAAIAAVAVEALELHRTQQPADPWDSLPGFRLHGRSPIGWELQPSGEQPPLPIGVEGPPHDAQVVIGDQRWHLAARRAGERQVQVSVEGRSRVWDHAALGARRWVAAGPDAFAFDLLEPVVEGGAGAADDALEAPMPGTVLDVRVAIGEHVDEGDVLMVIESMKMELAVIARSAATVSQILVAAGEGVRQGQALVELEAAS